MLRDTFFVTLFFVLLAMTVAHILGNAFFLYWKWWWFDLAIHFLGGFWAGGVMLWFFVTRVMTNSEVRRSRIVYVLFAVCAAFFIGILWETYEVLLDSTLSRSPDYFFDTVTDLVADSVGALCAGIYFLYTRAAFPRFFNHGN